MSSISRPLRCETILAPLSALSAIGFNDIRHKQIECTLSILRMMAHTLDDSWPVCLDIIGALQPGHTETLIRSSFQCLQLIVTDFLTMIRVSHMSQLIKVVARFGAQEQDLNISLTAVVLLWNISDFMFQNSERLSNEFKTSQQNAPPTTSTAATTTNNETSIESVWMVLYGRLGALCVDSRPAVRKSACQTLFCTISSHGSVLAIHSHWKELVWSVLFPLIEQVRVATSTASRERDKHANHPNFLMHHSRDTAEKQWAETSVLALAGVTRVFNSKSWMLTKLANNEFHHMWLFLLKQIEALAMSSNAEIAQSALRGFHELLGNQNYFASASSFAGASNSAAQTVAAAAAAAAASVVNNNTYSNNNNSQAVTNGAIGNESSSGARYETFDIGEWEAAWATWLQIGNQLLNMRCAKSSEDSASRHA